MDFTHPVTLKGTLVTLLPLEAQHFETLRQLAQDQRIWEFYPYDISAEKRFREIFELALSEKERGSQYPFVIFHNIHQKIIGSTRFLDIVPAHKKLEIGATWLQPDYWGTAVNLECKLLLLTYCFEKLGTVRVQLKTDENNIRSRKAILKIGAQFEGILRNDMLRDNNTRRNSAYFSIIEEEWPIQKQNLIRRLHKKISETEE